MINFNKNCSIEKGLAEDRNNNFNETKFSEKKNFFSLYDKISYLS